MGKVGGSKAFAADLFSKMMRKHGGQNKARNFIEANKIKKRQNEKIQREMDKEMTAARLEHEE